jgi:hypothetical protein
MSSPSRPRQDLDPVLQYAPPRVREQAQTQRDESSAAPPVDRPGRHDAKSTPEFSGDRAYVDMQRRLTLEPEWVPQPRPSLHGRDFWKTILRAGGMLGVIAIVAWLVVSTPLMKLLPGSPFPSARFPSTSIADDAAAPLPLRAAMIEHARSMQQRPASAEPTVNSSEPVQNAAAKTVAPNSDAVASSRPISTFANIPALVPQRDAPVVPAARNFVTRELDAAEVASFLQRADVFIKSGDLSAARLLLQRAAEAGDARAAFTLAGTFDPHVLKALGLRDGAPDIAEARLWYERASKLGSADAALRLQQLATTSAE